MEYLPTLSWTKISSYSCLKQIKSTLSSAGLWTFTNRFKAHRIARCRLPRQLHKKRRQLRVPSSLMTKNRFYRHFLTKKWLANMTFRHHSKKFRRYSVTVKKSPKFWPPKSWIASCNHPLPSTLMRRYSSIWWKSSLSAHKARIQETSKKSLNSFSRCSQTSAKTSTGASC